MTTFIDPTAQLESETIGAGTASSRTSGFHGDVTIGQECVLHDHAVLIGPIVLEDEVEVQAGAQLLGPIRLEQGVEIGARAVIGWIRRGAEMEPASDGIVVHRLASIGANATVWPGVVIGRGAVVEPGSVVRESVPANAVVSGNPARIIAYVDADHESGAGEVYAPTAVGSGTTTTRVPGVTLHRLTYARDLRGSLTATEFSGLPFAPQRLFTVFDVPSESVRGAHAHRECSQFLVCMAGTVSCLVDDGSAREEIRLEGAEVGLHISPMIWGTQWKYSRDAVLLVLASHAYAADDYIRDYEEFLKLRKTV